jgi:triacylglycerol esterase/lipase EstA (alpha/beta hydrolase family)
MVHGLTGRAGDLLPLKDYFVKKNYTEEEIYATTYGNGPAGAGQDGMKCEHIRQLRALIHAVRKYTNWPVDLTGYSMGVPICRKVGFLFKIIIFSMRIKMGRNCELDCMYKYHLVELFYVTQQSL